MVAAPPGHGAAIEALAPPGLELTVTDGAGARSESVARALALCDTELVAVHDAARPLVTPALIDALVGRLVAAPEAAAVIAAAAVVETIKQAQDARVSRTLPREQLWAAQTPQVFRAAALRQAHAAAPEALATATDDAALAEAAGMAVLIEPAPVENLKVTTPADLLLAELLLAARSPTAIRRAMPVLVVDDLPAVRRFYEGFLGFRVAIDEPGLLMLASPSQPTTQLIVCSRERSDTDPHTARTQVAVEVGDVDAAHTRAQELDLPIVYPLTDEPWGVRRFFVEDPAGTVINVGAHVGGDR